MRENAVNSKNVYCKKLQFMLFVCIAKRITKERSRIICLIIFRVCSLSEEYFKRNSSISFSCEIHSSSLSHGNKQTVRKGKDANRSDLSKFIYREPFIFMPIAR